MPRSKVSRGRGRGGGGGGEGYGSRSMETLFVPFAGTIEQNSKDIDFTLCPDIVFSPDDLQPLHSSTKL